MSVMREKIKAEYERVVDDEKIPVGLRDTLGDTLLAAETATNGAEDKLSAIADAVGALAICMSRKESYETERIKAAVKEHTDACPFRSGGVLAGKAATIYPYRWPLAIAATIVLSVALLSPFAGPSLARLIDRHGSDFVEAYEPDHQASNK